MHKNDNFAPECKPTASGILLCLRMLADESLSLNLRRSVAALRAAALVVEAEASETDARANDRPAARPTVWSADIRPLTTARSLPAR
jgi:hypothetical protein